ncbi:MAG: S8 family serine peptidase, partial [Fimbriimonadales bacterium]
RSRAEYCLKRISSCFVAVASVSLALFGCGGGSGGSGRPPVAPPPTCNGIEVGQKAGPPPQIGGGASNLLVPATSIEHPSDIGLRAHTNHLILASSVGARISGPSGLSPSQVTGAYGVPAGAGTKAIAIIDAFNYPTALNDFNVFSSTFGLRTEPSSNATASANQVFQVVYASGSQPANDGGWSQEMALDVEWAHAMAPMAKIYLVEAVSPNFSDLMNAVNVAKALPNVRQISMSFGGTETGCLFVDFDGRLVRNGVTFFGAAGDTAGARDYPALSENVVSVGGTSLTVTNSGSWVGETVWTGTGCGKSAFEPRPVFQDVVYPIVGLYRASCDISAVADPNTGVSVYDSFAYQGASGWLVFGGTSASCPIVAGIANASGVSFASSQSLNTRLYSGRGGANFHDITAGSSGGFSAAPGWDFPTGVGSPNGLGGFTGH